MERKTKECLAQSNGRLFWDAASRHCDGPLVGNRAFVFYGNLGTDSWTLIVPAASSGHLFLFNWDINYIFGKWPLKLVVVTIEQFSEKRTLFLKTVRSYL